MIDLENYLVEEFGVLDLEVILENKIKKLIKEKEPFYEIENEVGHGAFGHVFELSDKYVVKILCSYGDLNGEYFLNKLFYDEGISVPEPIGVFDVKQVSPFFVSTKLEVIDGEGFVMEYIHGIGKREDFKKLFNNQNEMGRELERLKQKHRVELDKCEKLGYIARDSKLFKNSIYVPETDKVVLLDFDLDYWDRR